jgi:predicted mannosyl-3-phosphoglycerate phosphatase (HAD superfamily)
MKIIMIDQDGVVSDKNYFTTIDISEFIHSVNKDPENLIVPNTDTPVQRIKKNFKDLLGLQVDIIIGENGAVIEIKGEKFYTAKVEGINSYRSDLKEMFEKKFRKDINRWKE